VSRAVNVATLESFGTMALCAWNQWTRATTTNPPIRVNLSTTGIIIEVTGMTTGMATEMATGMATFAMTTAIGAAAAAAAAAAAVVGIETRAGAEVGVGVGTRIGSRVVRNAMGAVIAKINLAALADFPPAGEVGVARGAIVAGEAAAAREEVTVAARGVMSVDAEGEIRVLPEAAGAIPRWSGMEL
jgi:hypothetical protein